MPGKINEDLDRIEKLLELEEGWNGYDAPPANKKSVEVAGMWLYEFANFLAAQMPTRVYESPAFIFPDDDGEICFEWFNDKGYGGEKRLHPITTKEVLLYKKLTVYVEEEGVWYIKVPSMAAVASMVAMEDGVLTWERALALWDWLWLTESPPDS